MKTGYLYNKTDEELQKDIKNGAEVSIGIDAHNLIDVITIKEIVNNNDANKVLAQLKQDLLVIIGKLTLNKQE